MSIEERKITILKRNLIQKVYEMTRAKLEKEVLKYSPVEMTEWNRWVDAAESGDYSIFDPLVTNTNTTSEEFAQIVLQKRDQFRTYRDAVINARNRHKEIINSLTTFEDLQNYNLNQFWP